MKLLSIALTLLACIYISGCSAQISPAPVSETISVQNSEYRLGTGDTLRLIVFGHEQLSGEFNIGASGKVSFPLILDTQVSGLTTRELEKVITEKLAPQYLRNPKVSVEVIKYRDVYILGEVRTPGKYPYIPNMTIQKAVAIAGGYTYRANEKTAKLIHQSQDTITTKTVNDMAIVSPGDTVIITRKWF